MVADGSLFLWALLIYGLTCVMPYMSRDWDPTERHFVALVDAFGTVVAIVLMIQAIQIVNVYVETFLVLFAWLATSWVARKCGYRGYASEKEKKVDEHSDSAVSGEGAG